jgi:hypothetical protein
MDVALKQLRIIWGALLLAILVYAVLCSQIVVHQEPVPIMFRAMTLVAVAEVLVLFIFRHNYVLQTAPLLNDQPGNASALARWRTGQIATWALSVSVALYGVVLRYLGFSFRQVSIFLIAGGALMLFLSPRRPQG